MVYKSPVTVQLAADSRERLAVDPLEPVNVAALTRLVAKTPFTMPEFERLVGWSFSRRDAPRSKRVLAWQLLRLSQENLELLRRCQSFFPDSWVSTVRDVQSTGEKSS